MSKHLFGIVCTQHGTAANNRAERFDAILEETKLTVTQRRGVVDDLPSMIADAERSVIALKKALARLT